MNARRRSPPGRRGPIRSARMPRPVPAPGGIAPPPHQGVCIRGGSRKVRRHGAGRRACGGPLSRKRPRSLLHTPAKPGSLSRAASVHLQGRETPGELPTLPVAGATPRRGRAMGLAMMCVHSMQGRGGSRPCLLSWPRARARRSGGHASSPCSPLVCGPPAARGCPGSASCHVNPAAGVTINSGTLRRVRRRS